MIAEHVRIPNDDHTAFVLSTRMAICRHDPLALAKVKRKWHLYRLLRQKRIGS